MKFIHFPKMNKHYSVRNPPLSSRGSLIMTLFIFVLPAIAVIYNIFKEKRVLKENQ